MENLSNKFKLTDEGDVKSYIGMNAIKYLNGTITMWLTAIIDKILNSLGILDESKMYVTPANVILTKYEYGHRSKQEWHYCSVIVQMIYFSVRTRPDILFDVHQCAKYSIYPKKTNE